MQYYKTQCGFAFNYRLTRRQRRTIGFHVTAQGLEIRAPHRVSHAHIKQAIEAKKPWIQRQLQRLEKRQIWWQDPKEVWRLGGQFPYLGQPLALQQGQRQQPYLSAATLNHAGQPRPFYLPPTARDAETIYEICKQWLRAQGQQYLWQRLKLIGQAHGLRAKQLRLGWSTRHWGWCRSDGTIMLNWRLMHYPPALSDYIIAHELAHLVHMNHSPEFWQWVEILYPDYQSAKQELARYHPSCIPIFSLQE